MAFFKVSHKDELVKDYSGSTNYIDSSGMFEVILKAVIVDTSSNGSEFINLYVDYNGQEQPIYQAIRLTNNDGSQNLGYGIFNKFCIVCGATGEGTEINDPVSRILPIGPKGENLECMVLEDFDELPVILKIKKEWYDFENPKAHKSVQNVFRFEDKATASEIVNNTPPGKQYEKELEKANIVKYRDNLTEEIVQAYFKNKKIGKTNESKPKDGFSNKRFGKK